MEKELRWDVIRGQRTAVAFLKSAVDQQRIGHAYLFSGPRGVGRRLTARVFAAAVLCEAEEPGQRPCGVCPSCRLVAQNVHPDMYQPLPETDKLLIDDVRRLHRRGALKPVRGRYKVFLIDDIGDATEQAQNSLLKVLEEPTGDAVFVLVAKEGAPPLPTVVSRCLTVRFGPLPRGDAVWILQNKFQYGAAAPLAAALGDGSLAIAGDGGESDLVARRDEAVELLHSLLGQGQAQAAAAVETWYKKPDAWMVVLDIVEYYLRDILIFQQSPAALKAPETWLIHIDRVQELAGHAARLPFADVLQSLDAVLDFRRQLQRNVGLRSALSVLFFQWASVGGAQAG